MRTRQSIYSIQNDSTKIVGNKSWFIATKCKCRVFKMLDMQNKNIVLPWFEASLIANWYRVLFY